LAIVKYWGKYGNQLPRNPSLSLTLESAFTETTLEFTAKEKDSPGIDLELYFNEERNEAFEARVKQFLTGITDIFPFLKQLLLTIHTQNSFPHSSGIASSASSMSALALCLCSLEHLFFETLEDNNAFDRKASFVARLGSGSACRSIFPTMALWGESGEFAGSSDYYAVPMAEHLHPLFSTLHDDILIVSSSEKAVSSSAGHGLMDNNPFAETRYGQARQQLAHLLGALKKGDLETFGKIAESEALTLHALMMSSNPSYILMQPNTLKIIELVRAYRQETKHPVYFSLDAGPNIHLLYPENVMPDVRVFVEEELAPLCEGNQYIGDWAGEGPEEL
jgi:diphosphomevalonate decarboxylase